MQCSPIHEKIKTNTSIKPSSGTNINLPSSKLTVLLLTIKKSFCGYQNSLHTLKGEKRAEASNLLSCFFSLYS